MDQGGTMMRSAGSDSESQPLTFKKIKLESTSIYVKLAKEIK
ncbi:MAG: hypothetical protein R2813_12960 [Flavobacteriales bacterium]